MIKVVCWNIGYKKKSLKQLLDVDADVALLQEVGSGMAINDLPDGAVTGGRAHWDSRVWASASSGGVKWPMVVKVSDRVDVEWFNQVSAKTEPAENEIAVNSYGLLAVARVVPKDPTEGGPFIAASMHAHYYKKTGTADTTASIISDLSALMARNIPASESILAAGDLNTIYGLGGDSEEQRVWDNLADIGLEFMGPQYPNGRQAAPTPAWLPSDTKNVVTFHKMNENPKDAKDQIDYVFASRGFHERVSVRALNSVEEWGASDHCRIMIEVAPEQ